MDVREKLVEQAISYFWYGISCDIFSEPVTTYAKLAIEALEKKKESGVTVQEWISVKDRLPEEWTNVLVYSGGNYDVLMYRPNRRETLCFMYQDECGHWTEKHSPPVTHWMPLPEPPKGE